MTREEAKELLPAITHFANGGNLWRYNNRLEEWESQTTVEQLNKESNIIEDKHFEARKAFALGEEIECRQNNENVPWDTCIKPKWRNNMQYRPKPEEPVYEWQWIYKKNKYEYGITDRFFSEIAEELNWAKFEPSKRIRH